MSGINKSPWWVLHLSYLLGFKSIYLLIISCQSREESLQPAMLPRWLFTCEGASASGAFQCMVIILVIRNLWVSMGPYA